MNRTKLFTAYRLPIGLLNLITIIALIVVASAGASSEADRKGGAPAESQRASAPKRSAKTKPLTAADHRAAETRLAELGYWTGKADGRWDAASRHALIAFQKVEGLKPTGRLTRSLFEKLLAAERPAPLETGEAHIEVDLVRQALFIVDGEGVVSKILPVSTGSGKPFRSQGWTRDAITHPGRYRVRQKIAGWKKSPLGVLYYPVYFMYGTAIHGHPSVPVKPASHGCVRIPMFAARQFHKMIPVGMPVIVHKGVPPPPLPAITGQ